MADGESAFIEAAIWHGTLEQSEAMLIADPGLAAASIHTAAVVGDDDAVRRFLSADPSLATAAAPPYGGDALNYLALSKYLRLDPSRSDAFLRAATAMLDAGADANTGFWKDGERETALYGAAGVAHHPGLTRLLLERGADPNDVEAVYHSPETHDLGAMQALVETGRVTPENLVMMLIRKHDWHDYDGLEYLLGRGADPNTRWGHRLPIHHGVARDNALALIELELDHGADPTLECDGESAVTLAARRGRGDLLALFERRRVRMDFAGALRLIAACARDDAAVVRAMATAEPAVVGEVLAQGSTLLGEFAGTWNAAGVGHLLDLGVPVDARYRGDGYFGLAPGSTALHVAAWKLVPLEVVTLLLARGADVNAVDDGGRTPLMLTVSACVDSYWSERRSPAIADALLRAGAGLAGVRYPSGYAEMDELLRRHGAAA